MDAHECHKTEVISDIKKNISDLANMNNIVIELKTVVSMLAEQSKKQDEIQRKQAETMTKVDDTVAQQGALIMQIANQQKEVAEEGSIKYTAIFQMLMTKALPPIILAGLTYWILQIVAK